MKAKMDELLGKVNDLRGSMRRTEEEDKTDGVASLVVRIVLIVGLCVLVIGTIYAVIQYLKPRYLDEYDDDFDLDDDFFEVEDEDLKKEEDDKDEEEK